MARLFILICLAVFQVGMAALPARAMGSPPQACQVPEEIRIERDTRLEPSCVYRATFRITAGNLVLDCRGALIDARGRNHGILIGDRQAVSHVTVKDCRIRGGGNGIFIGRTEPDAAKAKRHDRETLYRISPHHITLQGIHVADSERVGIYLDDYVSQVRIVGSSVSGAGSSGIYLEHSSRENEILDSSLTGNGFGHFPLYRFGASRREGLSIDSSAHNRVQGNRFAGNAAGAIFLYKNCQEHIHTNPQSVPRWQHASHNVIRGNHIENEKMGVWLASRQSRDLSGWDCGDPPYLGNSLYPDYARHNLVTENRFERVTTGVRVEDDDNTVTGNTFIDNEMPVELGAGHRLKALGKGPEGVTVQNNKFIRIEAE